MQMPGGLGPACIHAYVHACTRAYTQVPGGLGPAAASALGLAPGTPLAVGMIDAHAGGIGCLGAVPEASSHDGDDATDATDEDNACLGFESRLALIAGTSTCHMASSAAPVFAPGIWGPCVPIHACMGPYIRVPIHTAIGDHVCRYMHAHIHTYIHTYMCTYIHMYLHPHCIWGPCVPSLAPHLASRAWTPHLDPAPGPRAWTPRLWLRLDPAPGLRAYA